MDRSNESSSRRASSVRYVNVRARKHFRERGVSMTETAMLLFAIFLAAAGGIKPVGPAIGCGVGDMVLTLVPSPASGACGQGDASGGAASSGAPGSGGSRSGGSANGSGSNGSGSSGGGFDNGAPVDTKSQSFSDSMRGASPQQTDYQLAYLSSDVYNLDEKNKPLEGSTSFQPVSAEDLAKDGFTADMLADKDSGFQAAVYKDSNGNYVISYAGTEVSSLSDDATDVLQAAGGDARQYQEAIALASHAKAMYGNNVVLTGHSLGGGEAAAAAAATGLTAVTFNAAGVSDETLDKLAGVDPTAARAKAANGQVRNYYLQGDVLSTTQQNHPSLPQAMGTQIMIKDPSPVGKLASHIPGSGLLHSIGNHKIGAVLNGLNKNPPAGINPNNPS